MPLSFLKMHGLGNDFIVIDGRTETVPAQKRLAALTDRHTGIGCDQIIIIMPPRDAHSDAFIRLLNAPQATEIEACGNGTRCAADVLMRESGLGSVVVQTVAGLLSCAREADGRITVDMGVPTFGWQDIPLSRAVDTLHMDIGEGAFTDPVGVNIGNPHAVFFLDEVENLDLSVIGPRFEHDALFPRKANIEFVEMLSRTEMRMRVWERDTGETMACGSAACATLVAAVRRGYAERRARVILDGGPLDFHWRESDDHILMTGPVTFVFRGTLDIAC